MLDGMNEALLNQKSSSHVNTIIEVSVGLVFTAAFLRTFVEIAQKNPVAGSALAVIATPCIFEASRVFYGKHCAGLFGLSTELSDELKHIASHLVDNKGEINTIMAWSRYEKFFVMALTVGLTFPLGLTKIALNLRANPVVLGLEIGYLFAYSVIDALPHVAHLQLQKEAHKKFLTLPFLTRLQVLLFIVGHALTDSADLWNAPNLFWLVWSAIAMTTEGYLSHVEAIAHHHPHMPALTLQSSLQFGVVFIAACSIAFANWYNTYQLSEPTPVWSQILFLVAQMINVFFFTFEVWNHYAAAHDEHKLGGETTTTTPLLTADEQAEKGQGSGSFDGNESAFYGCRVVGQTPVSRCSNPSCAKLHK